MIVVHGGATRFEEDAHEGIVSSVEEAAGMGICVLKKGGSALDAVESATMILEDSGLFTAGGNSPPNRDGDVELDAAIMDGNRLESGAVMAAKGVHHPISLARYVLERTPVMQIVGDGATKLYKEMIDSGYREEVEPTKTQPNIMAQSCDTVGCVAVDENGRIAVSSSTSGWPGKLPGRVGDSPIIGAGLYANELAGTSCTGKGEQILRVVMARMAILHVENGLNVDQAVDAIMRELREKTGGEAGLILADSSGNVSFGFDTPHMPIAIGLLDKDEVYSSMVPKISEFRAW